MVYFEKGDGRINIKRFSKRDLAKEEREKSTEIMIQMATFGIENFELIHEKY